MQAVAGGRGRRGGRAGVAAAPPAPRSPPRCSRSSARAACTGPRWRSSIPVPGAPFLLLDAGANVEVRPGAPRPVRAHGRGVHGGRAAAWRRRAWRCCPTARSRPRAPRTCVAAHARAGRVAGLNFVGNVEGFAIGTGAADVIVADGFTGNVALKVMEGTSAALLGAVRGAAMSSLALEARRDAAAARAARAARRARPRGAGRRGAAGPAPARGRPARLVRRARVRPRDRGRRPRRARGRRRAHARAAAGRGGAAPREGASEAGR